MRFIRLFIFVLFSSIFLYAAVDLNTATKEELMGIKGIGEKKAEAIIEHRTKEPFKSVEDLKNVKGIGSGKIYDSIKDKVEVKRKK